MAGVPGQELKVEEKAGKVLNRTSLIEIVEAIGNKLFKQMTEAGVDWELGPTRKPRRKKRRN